MKNNLIEKSKNYFFELLGKAESDPYRLEHHIGLVKKWIDKACELEKNADKETILIGAWLHDIGYLIDLDSPDHSVLSEKYAREFLTNENVDKNRIDKICHIIRSHRNKDVSPETIEAKILAFADSASHFIDSFYIEMAIDNRVTQAKGKLERDYRDVSFSPELQKEITPLYSAWKKLLDEYEKLKI